MNPAGIIFGANASLVIQEVQQPPQETPVTQLESQKLTSRDECNETDAKVVASHQNSRSDRPPSKPKKEECTRRRQTNTGAEVKPVDANLGSSANQSQRVKKQLESETIWQFK